VSLTRSVSLFCGNQGMIGLEEWMECQYIIYAENLKQIF